ncbi:MAG: teichoic acid ABC transporter ATP-binding protein [Acidimicrobiaceae bacterium]|nr:teichoic acid ABC transporter ATP-binding protein [Acidimicrobiaceae bacterium]
MSETEVGSQLEGTRLGVRPVSIVAQDVHVDYRVYEESRITARTLFERGFRGRRSTHVHAVRGVSFEARIGDAIGIVGANGSGKSTLLRSIAGLQSLSAGTMKVRGEVGLLGVGAALKPKLSGYRNVMLGGLALGLSTDEVERMMPEIIEFSGLGEAMRRPMQTYSAGMKARLAFSIATLRIPDILLIDEALAVGDRDFKRRSLQRLTEIRDQAGTIVMVTHNLNEIKQSCTRAIWIDQGTLMADGDVESVLDEYEQRSDQ